MAKNSTFNISLKLLTQQFNKGIKDIQRQIKGLGNFIKGAFAIGSITAFGKQMVQTAADFEDAMARVQAVSNASVANMKMMSDEARKLGASTRYTATEAASALENLTRNGLSATQATKALSGVLQLAQANSIGLAEAADIVTNTMNMFGLSVKDTTRINDVLSATASTTATNITEIYAALVNAAPAAKVLGFSLEETTAAIGALAQRGVKAEQAGTALRMAFTKMVDPKIVAKMQAMGIAIDEQTMKEEGLLGTVKRLKDANLSMGDAVKIFSQRGAVGIQQLISVYDELETQLKIAENSAGATQRMFEQGVGSTRQAIDTLKSTYESFLISLGNKTSGVVNGVIKGLTNLIRNFNTLSGTIANIATLSLPLMIGAFRKVATISATTGKAVIGVLKGIKTAMGGWVGIAVTAVTLIGTRLVTAWNKHNAEVKEAEKALNDTEAQMADMQISVQNLINRIERDGKNSLNSVVKTATQLFPDFAEAIQRAANEAEKDATSGGFKALEDTLRNIANLQALVARKSGLENLYQAYLGQGADIMKKNAKELGLQPLVDYFKDHDLSDELLKSVLKQLLDIRARGGVDLKQKDQFERDLISSYTNGAVTNLNFNSAKAGMPDIIGVLRATNAEMTKLDDSVENATNAINREALEREARNYKNLNGKWDSNTSNEDLKKMIEDEKRGIQEAFEQAEDDAKKAEKLAEKIAEVETKLNNALDDIEDDFKNGTGKIKTLDDVLDATVDAYQDAYDEFRKLTRKMQEENPYYAGLMDAKENAAFRHPKKINDSSAQLTYKQPTALAGNRPAGKTNNNNGWQFTEFSENFNDAIDAADKFAYSLSNIGNAYETLGDNQASFAQKLAASIQVLDSTKSVIESMTSILDLLGVKEIAAAKIHEWASKKKEASTKRNILGNIAEAVSGAIKSVIETPVIGPLLAVAAAAGTLALISATVPKFANGGIVQGGPEHGDRMIARVNSGEMILNKTQQRRLLDIADGASSNRTVNVEFIIRGKNMYGVLRNFNLSNAKIAGSL